MGEKQDARVGLPTLKVGLKDGLEGDRSACCYAPARAIYHSADPLNPTGHECSKCDRECEILTEDEKIEINQKAKEAIDGLMGQKVMAIVIHRPTGEFAYNVVPLPQVREYAEFVCKEFQKMKGIDAKPEDLTIVEVEDRPEGANRQGSVRVSKLGV